MTTIAPPSNINDSHIVVHDMVILTNINSMRMWRCHYSTGMIFITNARGRPWAWAIEPANASDNETKPEIQLVANWKTIVPVWKHFGFEADEKGKPRLPDRSKCHVCQQEVAAKDGNTSNLYGHLKNCHPDLYLQVKRGQAWASMIVQQVSHPYQRRGKECRHFRPVLDII